MLFRTVAVTMRGVRFWVTLVALHSLLLETSCVNHHRRSMPTPTTLPVSKGGWRPVINSGLPGYGAFVAAPLHAPSYKIPVPVADNYSPSSTRPLATRDANKLTSIAQSYRPTTLRTLPSASPSLPPTNQPINSYYNPFGQSNNGLSHFKIVQNFPNENVVIRNPHNPYAARPVFKYQTKYKQPFHNSVYQQSNIPIQFGIPAGYSQTQQSNQKQYENGYSQTQQSNQKQYENGYSQTQQSNQKQYENSVKPVEHYGRPAEVKRPSSTGGTEIFKPEVYKLSDSDTAPQSVSQVKTAQQQQGASPSLKPAVNQYPQYPEKFAPLPPSILGTFSSFGVQSVKGRDPFQQTKTTYLPPQPTKQTIFNSFSFAPYFKSTPGYFPNTTPKFQTTLNQIHYPTTISDYKISSQPTQPPKVLNSVKVDPKAANKPNFKPSPQDPFSKAHLQQNGEHNKIQVSTYNPLQTTTAVNSYFIQNFNDRYPTQFPQNLQGAYYGQPIYNLDNTNKKQKIHDSIPSNNNQQPAASYPDLPKKKPHLEVTQNSAPSPGTYEVTETNDQDDTVTNPALNSWTVVTDNYEHSNKQQKPNSEDLVTKDEYFDNAYGRPATAPPTELPEEYAIVTEAEKGYENSLSYDSHVETQSRRPLGDDFEPIQKHKLKDYYYKVSTPSHNEYTTHYKRKHKSTTEAPSSSAPEHEVTTQYNANKDNDLSVEALPTLAPNQHFKRPNAQEPLDKDKIRKRNKTRRRRPPLANINRDRDETGTRKYGYSTEASYTTESEENHTFKPRVRVPKPKHQITTPTITTDLSTSALPTISPTTPTVIKKKIHRRPLTTTTDRLEITTYSYKDFDINKESPIMKIATRPQNYKVTTITYDYKTEAPDYSHKQDEKDTPTSDIDVNTESLKNKPEPVKTFSFHNDVKPIEAEMEPIRTTSDDPKKDINVEASEYTTTTPRIENSSEGNKLRRKNKYESNRPKFSVKDYRNRLSSTTTTTEKSTDSVVPKIRFPQRRLPFENKFNNENGNDTERKKFIPKDPRHKSENSSDVESLPETHSIRPTRQRHSSTTESIDSTSTQRISSRIRNGSRRPKPTEETAESSSPTTSHIKRPLRKKIKDSEIGESVQDVAITETTVHYDQKDTTTSERTRSESAIMKIAKDDKKHQAEHIDNLFEHSKRVSDLTLAASKDYNTPGMFKTVSPNSRRIPNYFTIATDDPILPIEAFFPQLNQKKES